MKLGRRGFVVGAVVAVAASCRRTITQPPSVPPVAEVAPSATASEAVSSVPSPTTAAVAPTTEATTAAATDPLPEPTVEPTEAPVTPVVAQVLCRDAWGAAPAGPDDLRHTPTRVTIHHTAAVLADNREAPRRWRGYQRFHQEQGWSDIAYHVGVDRGGNLYELRAPEIPGDTFTDYDPAGHHLIVADGNFEEQAPSPEQIEAVSQAAAAACWTYGVDPATIGGHRDHASTSCPGQGLYDLLPAIRSRAANLLAAGISSTVVCGPAADARITTIEA